MQPKKINANVQEYILYRLEDNIKRKQLEIKRRSKELNATYTLRKLYKSKLKNWYIQMKPLLETATPIQYSIIMKSKPVNMEYTTKGKVSFNSFIEENFTLEQWQRWDRMIIAELIKSARLMRKEIK